MADDAPTRRFAADDQPAAGGLAAGRRVFGRYVLETEVGRGGMGVVWRARDDELERAVALKFLPEVVAGDVEAVRDLKRETRRCLELTHPYIVRVYDFVAEAAAAAIAMELVDGQSLARRKAAARNGCLEVGELAPLAAQICTAMDYAHRLAKVVHRDLKPANILVTRDNVAKITDFGIARSLSDTHTRLTGRAGQTSGTLAYMSPQQLLGGDPSPADDIYALGATLYELLVGKPPFVTGDLPSQIREVAPKRLNERRVGMGLPALPAAWEETILACLAKEPEQRPRSVSEIAERLQLARPEPAVAVDLPRAGTPAKVPAGPAAGAGVRELPATAQRRSLVRYPSPSEVAREAEPAPAPERKKWQYEAGDGRKKNSWLDWVMLLAGLAAIGAYIGGYTPIRRFWVDEPADNSGAAASQAPPAGPAAANAPVALPPVLVTAQKGAASTAPPATAPESTPAPLVTQAPERPFVAGQNANVPGLNLALVWIKAGSFAMGSPEGEPGRDSAEGPQTRVNLNRPFWLGQTEVTQAQWTAVMGSNPSSFKGADRPVEQVSWDDVTEFCRKLTVREQAAGRLPSGYVYTLPTEAQWEYACRAGTTGAYAGNPDDLAWYVDDSRRKTHPVGQKQPNSWGLYDMMGNVWEWCRDSYSGYPGGSVEDRVGPASDSNRVVRGGSWNLDASYCRSARRGRYGPGNRFSYVGFRLALEPST
jgi:formylglycine-generating enzyme required for sulfatase activity